MDKRLRLRPSAQAMQLFIAVALASAALSWLMSSHPWLALAWEALAAVTLLALALDAAWALQLRRVADDALQVKRLVPRAFALGVDKEISLHIANTGSRSLTVAVFDAVAPGMRFESLPQAVTIGAGEEADVPYRVTPGKRGIAEFGRTELLIDSPLRLWQVRTWIGRAEQSRVYPNFAAVAKYALFATDDRLNRLGVRLKRRRGEGMEFHQLREYRDGDSLRQIDWKATTRLRKLVSREYQDERDQRLVFLLDTSRRMRAQDDGLSHFDHALNSLMLLSYVALRQGDSVGAMSFGSVERYFAPGKGAPALNSLTNAFYDIEPESRTGDYLEAAEHLLRKMPKRSLVVVLTNLRDEDEDELGLAIKVLSAKNLVVVASLREHVLRALTDTKIGNLDDAISVAAAHVYLEERRLAFSRLVSRDTYALDVEPRQLPMALVNLYLEIKRSGRL